MSCFSSDSTPASSPSGEHSSSSMDWFIIWVRMISCSARGHTRQREPTPPHRARDARARQSHLVLFRDDAGGAAERARPRDRTCIVRATSVFPRKSRTVRRRATKATGHGRPRGGPRGAPAVLGVFPPAFFVPMCPPRPTAPICGTPGGLRPQSGSSGPRR